MDPVSGAIFFTNVDPSRGFQNVSLSRDACGNCTATARYANYICMVMPCGLANIPYALYAEYPRCCLSSRVSPSRRAWTTLWCIHWKSVTTMSSMLPWCWKLEMCQAALFSRNVQICNKQEDVHGLRCLRTMSTIQYRHDLSSSWLTTYNIDNSSRLKHSHSHSHSLGHKKTATY